jgi:NAD(P)-dependent dehydrogenase (short-subunit alcohol dehydrogenase family)
LGKAGRRGRGRLGDRRRPATLADRLPGLDLLWNIDAVGVWNTAKHAVVGLVKGLAADLDGTGVTATVVSPGSTRTDLLQATAELYGVSVDDLVGRQLLGRVLDPDEVAAAVAFCCSLHGAVLNGTVLQADGGFRP